MRVYRPWVSGPRPWQYVINGRQVRKPNLNWAKGNLFENSPKLP